MSTKWYNLGHIHMIWSLEELFGKYAFVLQHKGAVINTERLVLLQYTDKAMPWLHWYRYTERYKRIELYPVHGANLTLIQPMWSAYPYAPTSLYGIHMPLLPYMVIQSIVLGMALLWAAIDSALSQGPLLWRHNDMTVIVSRNTRGRERDTRQRLNNANARRLQTVNR